MKVIETLRREGGDQGVTDENKYGRQKPKRN